MLTPNTIATSSMNPSAPDAIAHKVCITQTGMHVMQPLTLQEWADLGQSLTRVGRGIQFAIGDWINYGADQTEWGDQYTRALQLTGYDYGTLRNLASVARKVSSRNDRLSWEHHRKVAQLPPAEQARWLSVAAAPAPGQPPMSTRRLQKSILAGQILPADMPAEDAHTARHNFNHCLNLLQAWLSQFERADWFATSTPFQRQVLLDDIGRAEAVLDRARRAIHAAP